MDIADSFLVQAHKSKFSSFTFETSNAKNTLIVRRIYYDELPNTTPKEEPEVGITENTLTQEHKPKLFFLSTLRFQLPSIPLLSVESTMTATSGTTLVPSPTKQENYVHSSKVFFKKKCAVK